MDKLNFYTVDYEYVKFLQNAEQEQRGFYESLMFHEIVFLRFCALVELT
jgi:hypothetical protein